METSNVAYFAEFCREGLLITEMYEKPMHFLSVLELVRSGRLMSLSVPAGDLNSLLPDEDGRRLYISMKDHLLSTSLDDITQTPRKVCTHPNTPGRMYSSYS